MTQEDKELLLKDLCARIPYKTRVSYTYAFAGAVGINGYTVEGILSYEKLQNLSLPNIGCEKRWVTCILPYLRPMSSMTEEEKRELTNTTQYDTCYKDDGIDCIYQHILGWEIQGRITIHNVGYSTIDWLNAHHFDYRGLIEKGLALEAPEDMYKI